MPPEATLPHSDVNVPGDYFSLAGFEVTTYVRFWVTPEGKSMEGEFIQYFRIDGGVLQGS